MLYRADCPRRYELPAGLAPAAFGRYRYSDAVIARFEAERQALAIILADARWERFLSEYGRFEG